MGKNWEYYDKSVFGDRVGYAEKSKSDGGKHHTVFDRTGNTRMSWDTGRSGDYVHGSGHEVNQRTGSKSNWDK